MTQVCSGNLSYSSSQSVKNPNTEFFKSIVRESGIKLTSGDEANILTQEQALVVRDIDEKLIAAQSDDSIDKFLRGFRVLIKKEKYLKKALLPTVLKKSNSDSDVEIQQESLFRLFLKSNNLQKEIIDIILDELTSTISDEEQDVSHLRLLLSQLRYLPHIKTPQNLTSKLLDIIEIASFPCQLEILDSIPEILPDSEYNQTAEELTKILDKNDDLSSAIIDCLNALSLDSEIRAQIQDHILSKMLTGTCLNTFPIFLDFLLTDYNPRNLPAILMKIRNALNVIMSSQDKTDKEKQSSKIVIFNRLQKAAVMKIVSEGWLSTISSIKVSTDHKPIDLIILFMLHSTTKLKKHNIEMFFRRRIKEGQFKCPLLEKLFDKHLPQQLLRDYFYSIVAIGSNLLRSSQDPIIIDFASTLFKLLFANEGTDPTFRREILENIVLLIGTNDQKNITAILNILLDLLEEIGKFPNHVIVLMRLLEKIDSFELEDVKLVFEILCELTCRNDSLSNLKEELHMIIRKHLSSAKRNLKHRGIISAVVMAKHIATITEDQSDLDLSEDSTFTINHLKGAAKDAASILELTNTSTLGSPELIGLFYDQLACMIVKGKNLDRFFLAWLYETITNDFQDIYVTETVCEDINDLQFSRQFNLNTEAEMDTPIAVNIAELTLKSETSSILVLAPHFRLLRLLHYKQQNGDLSSIDALLGCGVILPKFEQRDSLDTDQRKQMSDCIFHCINWFRELISGFVSQKNKTLRLKIIQRLDNLHELELLLKECLESLPQHKLPQSYFHNVEKCQSPKKEVKAPRKKLKSKEIIEDTTIATTSKVTAKKIKEEHNKDLKFREIDIDFILLLKYPLDSKEVTSSDKITLNLNQLNFILKDFVFKLESLIKKQSLGFSHLNIISPIELMKDCPNILLNVNKHFNNILDKLKENINDEPLNVSFGLILECLSLVFSWSGFQHSKYLDLLKEILMSLRDGNTSTPLQSVNHLVIELVDRLSEYYDYCTCLSHGVNLIKIMESLHTLNPNSSLRSKIAKTAGKLLNKEWKIQNSVNIDILMKSYLSSASIKTICGMVGTLQDEISNLQTKTDTLNMLKSVTKSNFYIFYRNLWTCLHERVKIEIQSLTNSQHLTLWRTVALIMQGLMTIVKEQETKLNLVCFLKKSISILKVFLSHGIPILEIELKSDPDRVVEILKTIQSNTRFLHHLCCYSKLTKDTSLMNYVPQFRLTLETLIYRVKAALVANGCSAAFWMGNLKNRDLQGEDILSQSSNNSNREDENDEDKEILPSDDDEDMDIDNGSGSEVFQ